MQELLAELIRWLGYGVLRIATMGRYKGGSSGDELREAAFGLAVIATVTYVIYAVS